jgi:shikimate 5-dehydrogenase
MQAKSAGCLVVQGGTMLLEQGIEQFQQWQQRQAPRQEMTAAIFSGVDKIDSV